MLDVRSLRGRIMYRLLRLATAVSRRASLRTNQLFGRALGVLGYVCLLHERRKALRHLAIAFPEASNSYRRGVARAMFRHLGMSIMEITWLPNVTPQNRHETTTVEGFDAIAKVIDAGRGVVIFTAHCGNWEWLSYITGTFGRPVAVLQRERNEPEMNRYITEIRACAGVRTIDRGSSGSAREMIQALRRGGILAFVLDQNIRTESVSIPFFGVPAPTPIGPVEFAIRTGAVVATAFIERRGAMHHARFDPPIHCKPGDDPIALATTVTQRIEAQIRRVPEQWVWMHDRWRPRPEWSVSAEVVRARAKRREK